MSNHQPSSVVSQPTLTGGELELDVDTAKQSSSAAQKLSFQAMMTQENNTSQLSNGDSKEVEGELEAVQILTSARQAKRGYTGVTIDFEKEGVSLNSSKTNHAIEPNSIQNQTEDRQLSKSCDEDNVSLSEAFQTQHSEFEQIISDVIVIQPQRQQVQQLSAEFKRAKILIGKHAAEIKRRIFIAVMNSQLKKQSEVLECSGYQELSNQYDNDVSMLGMKPTFRHQETIVNLGFQINFQTNRRRLVRLTRIESNPYILSYFATNVQTLFQLQYHKKALKREWKMNQVRPLRQECPVLEHQIMTFNQPHFVFHLSKRLFSETSLAKSQEETERSRLNILSSEYLEQSASMIRNRRGLWKSHEVVGHENCDASGCKCSKDIFCCTLCCQQFDLDFMQKSVAVEFRHLEFSTCYRCSFKLVSDHLTMDDAAFKSLIDHLSFKVQPLRVSVTL